MKNGILFASLFIICTAGFSQKTATKKPAGKAVQSKPAVKATNTSLAEPWKQLNTKERLVEIETDYGTMIAKLYDSTPLHRNNFVKLVEQGFYDSLLFHRVIEGFMIQGGDPMSKYAGEGIQLGGGAAPGPRIPAEIKSQFLHKKGALAAARDNNPERASSSSQFYIVHGKKLSAQELEGQLARVKAANPNFNYTNEQKDVYMRIGGTPALDQNYTVFGEVISGLDVIDKIATVQKNPGDRPLQNVRMKLRMLN